MRPLSIRLFAALFGVSVLLSVGLALYAGQTMSFGFPIKPDAAATLAGRILMIRIVGVAFALSLMLLVVFAKSRAARGALALRWVLGAVTSVAFLRGFGLVGPGGSGDGPMLGVSLVQLSVEAFAILLLYGEDAAAWFDTGNWR